MSLDYTSIIVLMVFIAIIVFGFYAYITDKDMDFKSKYGMMIIVLGMFGIGISAVKCSLFYTYNTVYLEKIPDSSEYYIYQSGDKQDSLQYMENGILVNYKIDCMETKYDADKMPYIESKEGRNMINDVVKREVVIHLNRVN